ncbi:hypothetical protein ACKC9G_00380 [Pokkaliibacter sp. CJK22405]|uniref:hypothetical protein n=1 Tax=Pokkaliibacter sp. CJK22405 TaxID=3384615 RepID=UPI0039855BD9
MRHLFGSGDVLSSGTYRGRKYQIVGRQTRIKNEFNQVVVFIDGFPELNSGNFAFASRKAASMFGMSLVQQFVDGDPRKST